MKHGAKPQPATLAPAFTPAPAASPRAAVERALPVLQHSDVTFLQKAGCVSCHNNTLTAMAVARARSRGVPVDEQAAHGQKEAIGRFVASWRDRLLQGIGIPGDQVGGLFEPFTQAEAGTTRTYGGTGLGLTIVRELTRLMGGTVDVEALSRVEGLTKERRRVATWFNMFGGTIAPTVKIRGWNFTGQSTS